MKASSTKYISVRGTSSPNYCNNKSSKHCVTIDVASSKVTPLLNSRSKTSTKSGNDLPTRASLPPPPPPQTRRTIQHLALQLEYRILHHTGYVPKGAVPIAFFQQQRQRRQPSRKLTHIPSKSTMKVKPDYQFKNFVGKR